MLIILSLFSTLQINHYSQHNKFINSEAIKAETMSGSIANDDKHVNVHETNEDTETLHRMNAWIKSTRVLRKNSKRRGKKDARYLLLMS